MRCGVALYAGGGKVSLSPAAKMSSALANQCSTSHSDHHLQHTVHNQVALALHCVLTDKDVGKLILESVFRVEILSFLHYNTETGGEIT